MGRGVGLNGKRGIRMNSQLLFIVQFTLSLVIFVMIARWYIRPALDEMPMQAALVPLFFVHTLRYLPSSAFAPEQVDPRSRWMQWRGVGVDCRRRRPAHCNQTVAVYQSPADVVVASLDRVMSFKWLLCISVLPHTDAGYEALRPKAPRTPTIGKELGYSFETIENVSA
jgi:hypothetical protein